MNICFKKKKKNPLIHKLPLQDSLKSIECLNEWHRDAGKKLLQQAVHANPMGHGNFARDLFVWE